MLLIVAQHTDPYDISSGYYWEKLITRLSENHEILLITENRPISLEENLKINILQVRTPKFFNDNLNFGLGFLHKVSISFLMFFHAIRNCQKKEAIFIGSNPFLIILLPLILKVFLVKARTYILLFDLFPENLLATSNKAFIKIPLILFKFLFNLSYRKTTKIFSIGRDMSKILEYKKIKKDKIIYTPNWCDDLYDFDEEKKKKALSSLGIDYDPKKNIVILYFGNLGHFQPIEFFLNISSKTTNKKLIFLFVGNGIKKDLIKQASIDDNRIYVRDGVEMSERSKILVCGDVSLVTLAEKMFGLAVPSKSYFSLASNMPLLTIMNKNSEISLLVSEKDLGWSFSFKEKEKIISFLNKLTRKSIIEKKNKISLNEEHFRSKTSLEKISYELDQLQ